MIFRNQASVFTFSSHAAFSLVELLVVTLIVAVFALFAGPAYLRASRQERNLRDEAYVRTRLVMNLERIAREISLANDIAWIAPNGTEVSDSRDLIPGTNYVVRLSYPLETGGVSFESNRISKVVSVSFDLFPEQIQSSVSNYVDLKLVSQPPRSMTTLPVFIGSGGDPQFSDLSITSVLSPVTNQDSSVVFKPRTDLVKVSLSSVLHLDDGNRGTFCKTVSVDRLVRMWNR